MNDQNEEIAQLNTSYEKLLSANPTSKVNYHAFGKSISSLREEGKYNSLKLIKLGKNSLTIKAKDNKK